MNKRKPGRALQVLLLDDLELAQADYLGHLAADAGINILGRVQLVVIAGRIGLSR